MKTFGYTVVLVGLMLLLPSHFVRGEETVPYGALGCGGGASSAGEYHVHDTVGQPAIGVMSEPSLVHRIGYWCVMHELHIGPTSVVVITAFDARLCEDGVELSWTIGSASELEGFYVYRSRQAETGYARLNSSLIPPEQGNTYLDTDVRPARTYWYRLGAVDRDGEFMSPVVEVKVPPRDVALYQNYPNPFNPVTSISFYLPKATHVELTIYDVHGRRVCTVLDERRDHGKQSVAWDGKNDGGEDVSSGVYFYRMNAGGKALTKKLTVLR